MRIYFTKNSWRPNEEKRWTPSSKWHAIYEAFLTHEKNPPHVGALILGYTLHCTRCIVQCTFNSARVKISDNTSHNMYISPTRTSIFFHQNVPLGYQITARMNGLLFVILPLSWTHTVTTPWYEVERSPQHTGHVLDWLFLDNPKTSWKMRNSQTRIWWRL